MKDPRETREIRVFISSTFKDLETERDYLIKKTFPRLRYIASKRDVTITELDLRWGITAEESENHKTVEICLKEIDNSVPFFIGLVGDRYGWCPSHDDVADLEDDDSPYSWITDDIDKGLAVTEIEMMHGAFRSLQDINACFFVREQFDNTAERDNPGKIRELRERVKTNNQYPVTLFNSVEELDHAVVDFFVGLLDKYFPEQSVNNIEKERFAQQSFINRLCQNYINNSENTDAITKWVEDDENQFLAIVGDGGVGKSALLSYWVSSCYSQSSDNAVIFHSIGNGNIDNSKEEILQYISAELAKIYNMESKPSSSTGMAMDMNEVYSKVAGQDKKTIIILDGVNYLSSDNNDKQLLWIGYPPKNIRFIFSSVPSDATVEVFEYNDYHLLEINPFDDVKRAEIIKGYLNLYGKKISSEQTDSILAHPLMSNTLLLCTLLSEIVSFSKWQELQDRISYYLSSNNKREFYDKVLERFEQDFGYELTSNVLSIIVLTKKGISEKAIIDALNLSQLKFSQFHYAFLFNLSVINGKFSLANEAVSSAVKYRYIVDNKQHSVEIRKKLISYLEKENIDMKQQELPFQYYMAGDLNGLHNYLLDYDVFSWLYHNNQHELYKWWKDLLNDKDQEYSLSDYLELEIRPENIQALIDLSQFCENWIVEPEVCLKAIELAASLYCDDDTPEEILSSINYSTIVIAYSNAYKLNNQLKEAFSVIYDSYEEEKESADNDEELLELTHALAALLIDFCRYDFALEISLGSVEIAKRIYGANSYCLDTYLTILAQAYGRTGNREKSIEIYKKVLQNKIKYKGYNSGDVAIILDNIGLSYGDIKEYEKALDYHESANSIIVKIYGDRHPHAIISYNNLGWTLGRMGKIEDAVKMHDLAIECCLNVYGEYNNLTSTCYSELSSTLLYNRQFDDALITAKKALKIRNSLFGNSHLGVAHASDDVAKIYEYLGDNNHAVTYKKIAKSIFDFVKGGVNDEGAETLKDIALLYAKQSRYKLSVKYLLLAYDEYKELYGEESYYVELICRYLCNYHIALGNLESAMDFAKLSVKISRVIYPEVSLYFSWSIERMGDVYSAMELYSKALDEYMIAYEMRVKASREEEIKEELISELIYKIRLINPDFKE